jgi:hypothetical protein
MTLDDFESFLHYFAGIVGEHAWRVNAAGRIETRSGRSVLAVAQAHQIAICDADRPLVARAALAPLPLASVSRQPYDGPYMHQYVRDRLLKAVGLYQKPCARVSGKEIATGLYRVDALANGARGNANEGSARRRL